MRVVLEPEGAGGRQVLFIAGADRRGAIYGAVDMTRELGVSPWEWWADVTPQRSARLQLDGAARWSKAPSVQYRGIFLNDEDWGLQPWAAKTYEPEVNDIGPKTYARVFELMWRLKANTVWPAMHAATKPFYEIAGNAETADRYAIVMATSHAEPMARNNTREWDDGQRGPFNYFQNRDAIIRYWGERADQVSQFENLYTLGLRGKRDSGMFGAKSSAHARDAMLDIFQVQRDLLSTAQRKPADQIPQVLTLYKEVLDIYAAGLAVPDDVTLVWPEDNYGYINQLSNPAERRRAGGAGVYYHVSYLGRPHDYLWLATTHPALIREQMERAYRLEARKIWVVNVGDIKPAEYLSQYFLELAFDHTLLDQAPRTHLAHWAGAQFGKAHATEIADILLAYYDLAFERRPEFMGGGQTEPTRPNVISGYVRTGGAEAQARLDRYSALLARAERLAGAIDATRQDEYFQLVLYPVRGAANLNERILKLDLATVYAKAGRANVNALAQQARAAHQRIVADTAAYAALGQGKWRGMMNMAPRGLPVFDEPLYPQWTLPARGGCKVDASALSFVQGRQGVRHITVYGTRQAAWKLAGHSGFRAVPEQGELNADNGFEQRVTIHYDGKDPVEGGAVQCLDRLMGLFFRFSAPAGLLPQEVDRIISIDAASVSGEGWETVPGLGSRGSALRSRLDLTSAGATVDSGALAGITPLRYRFATGSRTDATLKLVALPVHPLTSLNRLRLAVRIDGGALQVLDFETFGRSEEWKRNVLSNTAVRTLALSQLPEGEHTLDVYALDPGFILDRIDVLLDGAPDLYGAPPIAGAL